jgi:transposase
MSEKRYPVQLGAEQQQALHDLIRKGKATAHQQMAARVLLKADEASVEHLSNSQIAQALEISARTVIRIKQRYVQQGLSAALTGNYPKERPERRKVNGHLEAHLIATACGPAPDGQQRWTLRLLADHMVQLDYAEQISYETVRQVLKKTN